MTDPPLFEEEVLNIIRETSEKYITPPSSNQILSDLLIGLKRFRNSVRWKEAAHIRKLEAKKDKLSPKSVINSFNFDETEDEIEVPREGFKTNLKGSSPKSAPRGSDEVEAFLIEIERKLITEFDNLKKPKVSDRAKKINELQKKLKDMEEVIIPTDKTNSFKIILLRDYKRWVLETLMTDAREIEVTTLTNTLEKAEALLMEIEPIISHNEFMFIKEFYEIFL